jgi:hypothetical protein
MSRKVAEQVQSHGGEPRLTWRGFHCAIAQTPRLVEPAEQQTGATECIVGPAAPGDPSARRLTLKELLAVSSLSS